MKCLRKYKWVKILRKIEIQGKGLMNHYIQLAGRVAFRMGIATYCGFENPVEPGMWAGGIVGLKSILGVKKRWEAFRIMNQLQELGYLTWSLDPETKLLTYKITDWVVECSGAPCEEGAVYASTGYGFYCMPRTITQRLVDAKVWDTSNRAINVIINNLKGIFFDDDNFEHMACGIVADWGEPGRTEVRICDFEDLKKCEIFR